MLKIKQEESGREEVTRPKVYYRDAKRIPGVGLRAVIRRP
jgi:hypothetical protein